MPNDQPTDTDNTIESDAVDSRVSFDDLAFNPDHFREDLAELELSREQENAILESLWNIMCAFIDIGWGVDSIQLLFPDLFKPIDPVNKTLLDSDEMAERNET